jgi:nucleotide-binding universal stress UspA family protein
MYNKILVPLDGSELAECVLSHVEAIAGGCGVLDITFLRVVEPIHFLGSGGYYDGSLVAEETIRIQNETKAAAERYMEDLSARVKFDVPTLAFHVVEGRGAADMIAIRMRRSIDHHYHRTHGRSGVSRG